MLCQWTIKIWWSWLRPLTFVEIFSFSIANLLAPYSQMLTLLILVLNGIDSKFPPLPFRGSMVGVNFTSNLFHLISKDHRSLNIFHLALLWQRLGVQSLLANIHFCLSTLTCLPPSIQIIIIKWYYAT